MPGSRFALKAAEKGSVALVTKRKLADSNTAWAQGGVACVVSEEDSFDLHIQDTLVAGAGLCNEEAVRAVVTEGPARIAELIELGMHFDERELANGVRELDLGREGGHSKRRVLHFQDFTGFEIERTLIYARSPLTRASRFWKITWLWTFITTGKLGYAMQDCCVGVYVLDEESERGGNAAERHQCARDRRMREGVSLHDQP